MWSHYADYHKGFAIQYDFRNLVSQCLYCDNLKQCESLYTLDVYPVIYGNKRLDATEMIFEFLKHEAFNAQLPFVTPDILFYTKASLLKSNDWKYEKEWRLICDCSKPKSAIKFLPKAIYLGSRISEINEKLF